MARPHGAPGVRDGALDVYHVREASLQDDPAEVQRRNMENLGLCRVCGGNARGLSQVVVTPISVPCRPDSGNAWELVQQDARGLGNGALIWETGRPGIELPKGLKDLLVEKDGRGVDDHLANLQGDGLAVLYTNVRDEVEEATYQLEHDEGGCSAGPNYGQIRERLRGADADAQRLLLREVLCAHCVNGQINGASHALLLATRSYVDVQIIRDLGQGKNAGKCTGPRPGGPGRPAGRAADAQRSVLHCQVRKQGNGTPDRGDEPPRRRVRAHQAVALSGRRRRHGRSDAHPLPPGTPRPRGNPSRNGSRD